MAKRIKTGRRASVNERKQAASWLKIYRLAQVSPNGRYCINPEDEPEFQIFIDANDPEPLLQALEDFVEHGTFEIMRSIEPLVIRVHWNTLRNSGMKYEDAIAKLAEDHNSSESTITRKVRRTVKA